MKVSIDSDNQGYITGYQQAFWDGEQWQAPFDTTNAVDLARIEVDKIVLGASKLVDGAIVVDRAKLAEMEEADKPQPSAEEQVALLQTKIDTQQQAFTELSNLVFTVADQDKLAAALGL
ncbi:phage infection protein [Lacticaseibacillus absianus]|uniref:phage infection protein n=1 Tax=Lacticaseibacillus absianus TaxID=2729623 RepID=UPI0015C7919A|nr:phage infection protein [Lacticaseibacillus absianus]